MPQIELLHTDCMSYMAGLPDKAFDLAIVDPPYGIGVDIVHTVGGRGDTKGGKGWDTGTPTIEYFQELRRVSIDQIIWGANYFNCFSNAHGAIIWDKNQPLPDSSQCEIASYSRLKKVGLFRHTWTNYVNTRATGHPTEKPVALYRWLLQNYAKPGQRILDTHLGSGSIAIACDLEGFALVGCEIDADYIKAARHRLAVHQSAPRLFEATPAGLPQQLEIGTDVSSDGT